MEPVRVSLGEVVHPPLAERGEDVLVESLPHTDYALPLRRTRLLVHNAHVGDEVGGDFRDGRLYGPLLRPNGSRVLTVFELAPVPDRSASGVFQRYGPGSRLHPRLLRDGRPQRDLPLLPAVAVAEDEGAADPG